MDSGLFCRNNDEAKGKSGVAQRKGAWILGGTFDPWWAIALDLYQYGIEARLLGFNTELKEIVKQAELEGGVIVIDLTRDLERGLAIMASCNAYSSLVPLIPIVADPSLDFAQRLRDLHAFCLAVHPIDTARVRGILDQAFRHVERMHLAGHSAKKKVLIIDDDKDYIRSVKALLEGEGYEVSCAMSGSEGLEKAISAQPDLIVLDVMMENMWAGYEVSQTLKFRSGYESVRRVPIVMVSSIEQHPAERFARSSDPSMVGPDVYMTKPLDVKAFVETIRSLLREKPAKRARA
jgi:two-component system, OmpR family, alkaline phosphatase synthesis response regulator PhoP